ncbi:hypothetical protein [Streptomyces anthocyanicus]|uniref:hypothetical protein n=1 Tax=Streptomyces anthocyanicus TaxID=68174 RepID=UPI00386EC158|nr:hypothetical protein OH747_08135 [Streptomyces anthocyanicus]
MAEAQIILSHSRKSGIVAIASGEQYPRAHTALTESGFQRDNDAFLRQARLSAPHRRPALPVTAPAHPLAATRSAYRSH